MLDIFIVAICLILNAFFSAYEMAFVTVSKDDLQEMDDLKMSGAKTIRHFKKKPERTLSVIQIGISLVGAVAAAVGGTGAVESLEPYFVNNFGISNSLAEAISVTIVIVPLTYLSVVFGELVPKTVALRFPIRVLTLGTKILFLIDRFLAPIVSFLEISTHFLLKLLRLDPAPGEETQDLGERIDIGGLPTFHQKFVRNLVELKSMRIRKCMDPWEKVAYLEYSDSEEEVRKKIAHAGHTRYPVLDGDVFVGILNVKLLPENLGKERNEHPWQENLRSGIVVEVNEKVLDVLLKLQNKRSHVAIVTENQKYVGLVTVKCIMEEIVGDIYDSSDISQVSKLLSNRTKINL